MGKKSKLYLLIIINLIAWGYVGYKVYTALQGDGDIELTHEDSRISKIKEPSKEDSLTLILNYSDPFLKNGNFSTTRSQSSYQTTENISKKINSNHISAKNTGISNALDIKYLGLIKNSNKGISTAMLNVNGKSVFVKQNDVVEGFVIKQITNESITVIKGKEKLVIKK